MVERFLYMFKMLGLSAAFVVGMLLPLIIMVIYKEIASRGQESFSAVEYDRIENRAVAILLGGYLLMLCAFFFITAPVHAAPVNAASIVRAKCKRTPPEIRSEKCKRLVGTNYHIS